MEPVPANAIGEFADIMVFNMVFNLWSCCSECVWDDRECEKRRDLYLEDGYLCCEGFRQWTEEA